jgi:hypothetical protein
MGDALHPDDARQKQLDEVIGSYLLELDAGRKSNVSERNG